MAKTFAKLQGHGVVKSNMPPFIGEVESKWNLKMAHIISQPLYIIKRNNVHVHNCPSIEQSGPVCSCSLVDFYLDKIKLGQALYFPVHKLASHKEALCLEIPQAIIAYFNTNNAKILFIWTSKPLYPSQIFFNGQDSCEPTYSLISLDNSLACDERIYKLGWRRESFKCILGGQCMYGSGESH